MSAIGTVLYGRPPAVLLLYSNVNLNSLCPTDPPTTVRTSGWILMKLKEKISTRVKLAQQRIHCGCESLVGNGTLKEDDRPIYDI